MPTDHDARDRQPAPRPTRPPCRRIDVAPIPGRRALAALACATLALLLAACGDDVATGRTAPSESILPAVERAAATNPAPDAADAEPISIRFDSLSAQDGLRLTISVRGDADGDTAFSLHPCCGIEGADRFVRDVRIRASGRPVPTRRQGARWTVAHAPRAPLSVSYRLPPSGTTRINAGPAALFRPLVDGAWFHLIGHAALLLPVRGRDGDPVALSIDATGLPTPGTFVSSFGAGAAARGIRVARSQVLEALYLGGATHLKVEDTRRGRVAIAHTGIAAGFPTTGLSREVLGVVDAARDFFGSTQPWYLVSVHGGSAQDRNLRIGGGTGLTNTFAMFVASDLSLADAGQREQFRWLLAHEYTTSGSA